MGSDGISSWSLPIFLLFMYFCIKNCIGTQGEDLSTVKVL